MTDQRERGEREGSGKLTGHVARKGPKRLDSPRWKSWLARLPLLLHETVYFEPLSNPREKDALTMLRENGNKRATGRQVCRSWSWWSTGRGEMIDALSKRV
jgi:hypothetical protein